MRAIKIMQSFNLMCFNRIYSRFFNDTYGSVDETIANRSMLDASAESWEFVSIQKC